MGRKKIYLVFILIGMLSSQFIGCAATEIVGGPVQKYDLKDGAYEGSAKGGPVKVLARVTIQNQRITNIEFIKHRTLKGKPAEEVIPARIIDQQSTSVDAVSGATLSSRVIMNAVEDAIRKTK